MLPVSNVSNCGGATAAHPTGNHWPAGRESSHWLIWRLARPIHDDGDTCQTDGAAEYIERIGRRPVHDPPPDNREHHKPASIGGIDAAEVRGLIGRHDTVKE